MKPEGVHRRPTSAIIIAGIDCCDPRLVVESRAEFAAYVQRTVDPALMPGFVRKGLGSLGCLPRQSGHERIVSPNLRAGLPVCDTSSATQGVNRLWRKYVPNHRSPVRPRKLRSRSIGGKKNIIILPRNL